MKFNRNNIVCPIFRKKKNINKRYKKSIEIEEDISWGNIEAVDSYVVRSGLDLRVQSMLILVPEWRITDQKDVKNDTARPDVDWLAVWLFLQDFRAEVTGRPSETFFITRLSEVTLHRIFCVFFSLKYKMGSGAVFS